MHSRQYLHHSDFSIYSRPRNANIIQEHWKPDDRVAFVAQQPEQGIMHCGSAILLLTHWFWNYRQAGADREDFFDYPQHYAVVGEIGSRTQHVGPEGQRPWGPAWCRLDVWPSTHHVVAKPTPEALMLAVLSVEPQWLFWPASLPAPGLIEVTGGGSDAAVRAILKARLKGIVLYGDGSDTPCEWSITLSGGAAKLISESMQRLTDVDPDCVSHVSLTGWYRNVSVEEFLGINQKP